MPLSWKSIELHNWYFGNAPYYSIPNSVWGVADRKPRYASTQRSRPMLLSAYICRPATIAAKHPETRTAFVPVLHSKQMWPSSIHSNMCCCISIHLCVLSAVYVDKHCTRTLFFSHSALRSPENKQLESINYGLCAARACLGRIGGSEGRGGWT